MKVTMTLNKLRNCIQNSPLCKHPFNNFPPKCFGNCTFGNFCALDFKKPVGSVEFCTNESIHWIHGRARKAFDKLMAFMKENDYWFSDDFGSIYKNENITQK